MSQFHKNVLAGGITGMAYKSTLGLRASLVGGVVGMILIGSLHLMTDELRKRDLIDLEMRFDD